MKNIIKSLFSRSAAVNENSLEAEHHMLENKEIEPQYRIQTQCLYYGGVAQLQIVKQNGLNTELHSQFELQGCQQDVVLTEWLDSTRFVAVDKMGQVYIAAINAPGKFTLAPIFSFEVYPTKDVCLQDGKLYLVGAKKSGRRRDSLLFSTDLSIALTQTSLEQLSTTHFTIEHYEVPFRFVDGSMVYIGRDEFVFYQLGKKRTHQLVSFNPITAAVETYELAGKPAPDEIPIRHIFFQDKKHATLILANAETVTLAKGADDEADDVEPCFDFSVQFIDFKQKKTVWNRVIRSLSAEQICDKYDREELVESLTAIAGGDVSSSHHDQLQTFIECLTSATLAEDGQSIWLGWQDNKLQQISLNGECLTPLYSLIRAGSERGLSLFEHEPVVIQGQIDQHLMIAVGMEDDEFLWQCDLAQAELANTNTNTNQLQCAQSQLTLTIPNTIGGIPAISGQVDVPCQDFNDDNARVESLRNLLALMPAWQSHYEQNLRDGSYATSFYVAFNGQQACDVTMKSEYDVFPYAASHAEGADLIAQIIAQYATWSCAGDLVGAKGHPALADAVMSLVDKRQYLPVIADYFCAIGSREPVNPYHIHQTLPVIREVHADTPELTAFMAKVTWPWNDASYSVPNVGDYDD
ncbi:hypothetical protein VSVS12_03281 [Vibrio scophthalmi]|uniref:hypothetical protein n=1 Tax=Vibrio scophthalmi TaxID=45658 RepID=UPI00080921F3|nr:hypothetical protein [Vibrio scophthalmi]ANS86990.1 hypothetical protein VSVS12_03281 [Vibrio scophthalmi]